MSSQYYIWQELSHQLPNVFVNHMIYRSSDTFSAGLIEWITVFHANGL